MKQRWLRGSERLGPRAGLQVLATLAAILTLTVLAGLSLQNRGRYYLHCNGGELVAHRGLFWPWGSKPVAEPSLGPVSVPPALCHNIPTRSWDHLVEQHRELQQWRATRLSPAVQPAPTSTAPQHQPEVDVAAPVLPEAKDREIRDGEGRAL